MKTIQNAKKRLEKKYFYRILRKIKRCLKFIINKRTYSMNYEKPIRLGKLNPNTIFYLIGYYQDENFPRQGILSTWLDFMPKILYALEKGYVPIIDMKNNYKPMMLDENNRGKINAWEIYFKQPFPQYNLNDVLHSKKVIFAKNQGHPLSYDIQWSNLPLSDSDFKLCQSMIKYEILSDTIIEAGDMFIKKNIPTGKKVLGVSFRREFERLHHFNSEVTPSGTHIVRATLSNLIKDIHASMINLKYDYIFFTADDRESYNALKKEFGDKCVFVQRPVAHHFINNEPVPLDRVNLLSIEYNKRTNDTMLREIEYMTDVYILSKCDSLLAAGGSVDLFAYILNNKQYEHIIQPKESAS